MADMELHGQAMLDYLNGEEDAHCILRRDDGFAYPPIYARQFFHPDGLSSIDRRAVDHCFGRVLDLGAGAGSHSLAIQQRGLDVTSVDASAKAVEVMRRRGVRNPLVGDIYDSYPERFDTVLVALNIGIVGDLAGLDRFLHHLETLLAQGGQLLTDSYDPRNPAEDDHKRYQKQKSAKGGYFGERTLRFEYQGQRSDWFEWMHVDPEALGERAIASGWQMRMLAEEGGRFLAAVARNPRRSE